MSGANAKKSPAAEQTPAKPDQKEHKDDSASDAGNADEAEDVNSASKGDATGAADAETEQGGATETPAKANGTPASASKSAKQRKSSSVPEHKTKKLNRKASKAKITHIDAQPGDYFYVRMKGYPQWPVIVCDEEMLPEVIAKNTPVSGMRDGVYREQYADAGVKVHDRSFAVMFLGTNEFAWVNNTELIDLDLDTVGDVKVKGKALQSAHDVAADKHSLDYFKKMLNNFAEEQKKAAEEQEAKEAKKFSKGTSKSKVTADEEDTDMVDAEEEEAKEPKTPATASAKKSKKRKAEDEVKETDSVKKPRTTIKLNTKSTPKATNGTSTPKSTKEPKSAKNKSTVKDKSAAKVKKATTTSKDEKKSEGQETAAVEPELSAAEKHEKKQKEILYVRHRLQKGLLDKGKDPNPAEMPAMDDWLRRLEQINNMEGSIIAATKINKLLKAIVKMTNIPNDDEHNFKGRSATLLEQWNKILNNDATASTNGHGNANATDTKLGSTSEEAKNGSAEADAAEPEANKNEASPTAEKPDAEMDDGDDKEPVEKEPAAVEASS